VEREVKIRNRLRLYFSPNGAPLQYGGSLALNAAPAADGHGPAATLYEGAPFAACGCGATWELGEFVDGVQLEMGWFTRVGHRQSCRKASA
jgi:hypothetical protein